jgi:PAS domain S-box-containing protein
LLKTHHPLPWETIQADLLESGSWTGELIHQTKDGQEVIIESRHQLMQMGERRVVLVTNRDITQRKAAEAAREVAVEALRESEHNYRNLFDTMLQGVVFQDVDGTIIWMNPAAERILGKTQAEFLGQTSVSVEHDTLREDGTPFPGVEHPAMVALRTGQIVRDVVMQVYHPRRMEYRWILVSAVPRFREGETVAHQVYAVFEDITERRQSEDQGRSQAIQIELQRRLLDQREQERLQIARDLHDGPVQEVTGAMYALQHVILDVEDQKLRKPLEEIYRSLNEQIGELRVYAGELRPPSLSKFGFEKAIRSHLDDFQEKHPEIQVHLEAHQEGELTPDEIRLALFRIYQQAMNNVVKHAQATEVWVHLSKSNDRVALDIRDNGIGFTIPQDWLDLARQGHLGLVGMRERAEAIGGTVEISSQLKGGTLIHVNVRLPSQADLSKVDGHPRENTP